MAFQAAAGLFVCRQRVEGLRSGCCILVIVAVTAVAADAVDTAILDQVPDLGQDSVAELTAGEDISNYEAVDVV